MSTARAIQVSVTHLTVGTATGAAIDALMPAYSASASTAMLAFEALVQIALNGVVLAQVGSMLVADDPTYGVPFQYGLLQAQGGLHQRIDFLAAEVKRQGAQFARKMVAPVPKEAYSTQDL